MTLLYAMNTEHINGVPGDPRFGPDCVPNLIATVNDAVDPNAPPACDLGE